MFSIGFKYCYKYRPFFSGSLKYNRKINILLVNNGYLYHIIRTIKDPGENIQY